MDVRDLLTLEEATVLHEMQSNSSLMSALDKVFQYESRRHMMNLKEESLRNEINTPSCAREAANVRKLAEWKHWFSNAVDRLSKSQ
jgi:hypothetical protein